MFNAEKHFLSKVQKGSTKKIEEGSLRIWLGNTSFVSPNKKATSKIPAFPRKTISEKAVSDLHQLFVDFVQKAKKESSCEVASIILYKMELLGALVSPIQHSVGYDPERTLEKGVIVNETKNTLEIAFHGKIKIYPKHMHNFILYVENRKYFVIGPSLKIKRRFSK